MGDAAGGGLAGGLGPCAGAAMPSRRPVLSACSGWAGSGDPCQCPPGVLRGGEQGLGLPHKTAPYLSSICA